MAKQPAYSDELKHRALELCKTNLLPDVLKILADELPEGTKIPNKSTLSRWAKAAGVATIAIDTMRAANESLQVAVEARSLTLKEKRQILASEMMDNAIRLNRQMFEPTVDVLIGGKFNDQRIKVERDEPTFSEKRAIAQSVSGYATSSAKLEAVDATTSADSTAKSKDLLTRMGEQMGIKSFEDDYVEEVPDVGFSDPSEAADGDLSEAIGLPEAFEQEL